MNVQFFFCLLKIFLTDEDLHPRNVDVLHYCNVDTDLPHMSRPEHGPQLTERLYVGSRRTLSPSVSLSQAGPTPLGCLARHTPTVLSATVMVGYMPYTHWRLKQSVKLKSFYFPLQR
ncbi:hypothetical protein J6590_047394 [Homalodisca vitripennis]|nr:hypothetical protein J6590_047394 [Homalodisca vitripennis]